MERVKRILRIPVRIISIAGPAIILAAVLAGFAGVKYLCVLSPSMEPEMPVGSLIAVVPAKAEKMRVGRDVTYKLGANYVTHRVVEIREKERMLVTKGLANERTDAPVSFEAVVGVPVLCVPGLGKLTAKFSGTGGKIMLISAGSLAVVAVIFADMLLEPARGKTHFFDHDCESSWNKSF